MRPRPHGWASLALLACALAVVRPALAEDPSDRKRVVVLKFSGPQGTRVHAAVVAGLKRQVSVVDEDEFGEILASAQGPTRPDRIAAACREMGVDAAVEGLMRRAGRVWSAEVFVRDCANGEKIVPSGRATFSMRNLGGISAIRGSIWGRIRDAILGSAGGGGGGSSVAASSRPGGRTSAASRPSVGSRPAAAPAPPARPAASARPAPATQCEFSEDEPPEGFPGYGDWVRRRNAFLVRCEADRVRRAQEAVRERQEAERRARAEAQDRARRAAEEEQRRRDEEQRALRAEETRRRREADERQRAIEDARRRREEEARVAERRQREEEERAVADRRRREQEEEEAARQQASEEDRRRERRRHDQDIEREVAAYRTRLERERVAALEQPDYDDRRRVEEEDPPPEEEDPSYEPDPPPPEEEDPPPRRERRHRYDEDDGGWDDNRRASTDEDPVYDPDRDDPRDRADPTRTAELEHQEESPASRTRLAPTILRLGAGLGFVNRQMTVAVEGSAKPRSYSAPGYPEMSVEAGFFPAALTKNPGAIGGLGAYGVFRRHLFLQTTGIDAITNQPIDIPTSEQELAGGVMFRAPMGSTPRSPVFEVSLGYGYFQFMLDVGQMQKLDPSMQMPTMTYVNVIGNAGVAIPLDDRGLAVQIGGTYRYVLDVGQTARDLFGADTTGGYAFGGHLELGGEAAFIAKGLAWAISADALVFNTEFQGASSADGGRIGGFPSGSDRYLRGTAMLGYRFR